jgi:hypothetical protein
MVKRQNDSRTEQPGLVKQTTGEHDEVGVLGVDGLSEHRGQSGAGGVRQSQSGTTVGPVVAQHRDIVIRGASRK